MTADQPPLRVLFLCTGNSARSQMAEALLRQLSKGRVEVFSAGSKPQPEVHPLAKETLESARRRAFAAVANGLSGRLRVWMSLPAVHTRIESAEPSAASAATPPQGSLGDTR